MESGQKHASFTLKKHFFVPMLVIIALKLHKKCTWLISYREYTYNNTYNTYNNTVCCIGMI